MPSSISSGFTAAAAPPSWKRTAGYAQAYVYGNPGGLIPAWLANYAAARSVTKTMQNMQSAVKRYDNARSAFVNDASIE
jgi:hypothetical protein